MSDEDTPTTISDEELIEHVFRSTGFTLRFGRDVEVARAVRFSSMMADPTHVLVQDPSKTQKES